MSKRAMTIWTFIVTSVGVFMVSLDNLVVTTALPVIKRDLGASLSGLEWTVNAYTLTFAVLLLTGAALGDRFGRKRMFLVGLAIFTLGSAFAAVAPSIDALIAARALQGMGGAIVTPLTLTILSAAVPPARRGLALGIWSGTSGLAVALGPVIGGAVVEGFSWQMIFWVNVPIGLALLPVAFLRLSETRGPSRSLDLPGLALASTGLFGIVWGLVRGNAHGWTSFGVLVPMIVGAILVVAFVAWELRAAEPMVPMRFFRRRAFSAANLTSVFMSFGMFGSIFLLAQFFQLVQGYTPLQAGLRTLPWTAMPMLGGAHRRLALRPHRQPAAADRRHGPDGDGARLVGGGLLTDRAVRRAGAGVRDGRCRHVALLRPGRQPGAVERAAQRRGQGSGVEQYRARGRRRVRRGGAGVGVLGGRQLPHADLVRERPDGGPVGRRRRRRCGHVGGDRHSVAPGRGARLGVAAGAARP